jgi:hypothetical protein
MVDLSKDTFSFFIPIEPIAKASADAKDKDDKGDKRWIQGIASTEDRDLQDEVVQQTGLDLSYFLKHGYINDDHHQGPEAKVGEPTDARVTKAGLWIKGFLFKGHQRADYWWELLNALDQSGSTRKVGFSIEGKVLRRTGKSIVKCWIKDIAITASPVNTATWAEVAKSLRQERWCIHPWKSLEKACKGCPGPRVAGASCDEAKAMTAAGSRMLVPQSLEGRNKLQTFKSVDPEIISFNEAVQEIQRRGYSPATSRAMASAIFAQHRR